MGIRYSSWGADKAYRWLWRAALQDAIFAFRNRLDPKRSNEYTYIPRIIDAVKEALRSEVNYIAA